MIRRTPRSTRTDTLFPYTTLFRSTDRTCAHDRHAASRRDLPVENPAFIAGGQDVAEHDERFLVRSGGYRMEAVVGMRNADEFRLRPVDGIAQDPPAVGTVRIHPATAIFAARAGGEDRQRTRLKSRPYCASRMTYSARTNKKNNK